MGAEKKRHISAAFFLLYVFVNVFRRILSVIEFTAADLKFKFYPCIAAEKVIINLLYQ